MKQIIRICLIVFLYICITSEMYAVDSAGSRASFTRGGWAGAQYTAMGKAAEMVVNDVFAIYWNPAGLTELLGMKKLSGEEIKEKARAGDVNDISEEDLLKFSEDEKVEKSVFQIGASAGMIDIERNAGFGGIAFDMFGGVFGAGLYSLVSTDIEGYDDSGNRTADNLSYVGAAGIVSYGWTAGLTSVGISFKGLYEKIGDVTYNGGGMDFGTQVAVLPFLKIGIVAQDLGAGLYPTEESNLIEQKYDVASPVLKMGAAVTSDDAGITFAFTGIKKLEQDGFTVNVGVQYDMMDSMAVYMGLNDAYFSAGVGLNFFMMKICYSFSIDRINYGYNNLASVTLLF